MGPLGAAVIADAAVGTEGFGGVGADATANGVDVGVGDF